MTRLLVLMGSGETTPTMVTTHQQVFAALGHAPSAVLLDTPYGFQENADQVTAKARRYFAASVGVDVGVASLRRADALSAVGAEAVLAAVRDSSWVFAGPGSPSYLVREWLDTDVPDVLRLRLAEDRGATVFASAAAVTVGAHAAPIYEIYKAGADPHWTAGLGLLADIGLDAVCIPHFDNSDGGGEFDTRFCYLGERRLAAMEAQLPSDTWVLGVDEHTAMVVDLASGAVQITGRGRVTVRARDTTVEFGSGSRLGLEDLVAAARGTAAAAPTSAAAAAGTSPVVPAPEAAAAARSLGEEVDRAIAAFDEALAAGDALRAAEGTLGLQESMRAWADDVEEADHADRARAELRRQIVALARVAQAGLHEHRDLVAPHVEVLLDLRERARADRRFDDADAIRDTLIAAGIEVRDTPEGPGWTFEDPLDAAPR